LVMNALVSIHQVRIPGSSVLTINTCLGVPISFSTLPPCLIHNVLSTLDLQELLHGPFSSVKHPFQWFQRFRGRLRPATQVTR
jgi:hypothetical protein